MLKRGFFLLLLSLPCMPMFAGDAEKAFSFYRSQDYKSAANAFQDLAQENDSLGIYWDFAGRALILQGAYDSGITKLNEAEIRYERVDSMLYYFRAEALVALGRDDLATADIERFAQSRPKDAQAQNMLCIHYYRLNRLDAAIEACAYAYEVKQSNLTAYKFQGLSQYKQGVYLDALVNFQTLCSIEPDNPEHWYLLGLGLKGMENPDLIGKAYRRSIKASPQYIPAYRALANFYLENAQADSANLIYEKLVDAFPDSPQFALDLANSYYQEAEYTKAITYYRKVLEVAPEDSSALFYEGAAHFQIKDFRSAADRFKKVLEIHPRHARACNMAGMCYLALVNPTEAKNYFKQATLIDANFGQAYYNLGRVERLLDNYDLAANAFRQALQVNLPEHLEEDCYFQLGECYAQSEASIKAIVAFQKVLESNPKRLKALEYLGDLCYLESDYVEAINYFEQLASLEENYMHYYKLGICYLAVKDYPLAVVNFETAIQINPEHASSHTNLANTYAYMEEYEMAIEALNQALIYQPDDPRALVLMGYCLRESGNRKEAKVYFEQAKAIDPEIEIPY